jgi:hypothetical protein
MANTYKILKTSDEDTKLRKKRKRTEGGEKKRLKELTALRRREKQQQLWEAEQEERRRRREAERAIQQRNYEEDLKQTQVALKLKRTFDLLKRYELYYNNTRTNNNNSTGTHTNNPSTRTAAEIIGLPEHLVFIPLSEVVPSSSTLEKEELTLNNHQNCSRREESNPFQTSHTTNVTTTTTTATTTMPTKEDISKVTDDSSAECGFLRTVSGFVVLSFLIVFHLSIHHLPFELTHFLYLLHGFRELSFSSFFFGART